VHPAHPVAGLGTSLTASPSGGRPFGGLRCGRGTDGIRDPKGSEGQGMAQDGKGPSGAEGVVLKFTVDTFLAVAAMMFAVRIFWILYRYVYRLSPSVISAVFAGYSPTSSLSHRGNKIDKEPP